MVYQDRRRAEGFGALADQYDRTRPSYPDELIAWLTSEGAGTAVDVGSGTGRVARLLAARGWKVIGIEPDPRMADIARSHGVDVAVTTFERWQAPPGHMDLVAAGTAWHWVDPEVGHDKAAAVLRPGGVLAIFRNSYRYDAAAANIIQQTLRRHAPHLLADCVPLGTADPDRMASHRQAVEHRGDLFCGLEQRAFRHQRVVPVDAWIAELATHSPLMLLDRGVADQLLADLAGQVRSQVGERVHLTHAAHTLRARRR